MIEGQKLDLEVMPKGVLEKTKRRRSKLKLEHVLDNLGPMEEID